MPCIVISFLCSIYDKIGRGKHSTVYKGRKKKTIQYYAIKSVDKSQKPRVLQEVRLSWRVICVNRQSSLGCAVAICVNTRGALWRRVGSNMTLLTARGNNVMPPMSACMNCCCEVGLCSGSCYICQCRCVSCTRWTRATSSSSSHGKLFAHEVDSTCNLFEGHVSGSRNFPMYQTLSSSKERPRPCLAETNTFQMPILA